jgi:S1-C subfamily serine protease
MSRRPLLRWILLCLALAALARADDQDLRRSVLRVFVTYQEYDPFMPWQKQNPNERAGYGAVIEDGLVVTTETLVRNGAHAEVQLAGSGRKLQAVLDLADPQVNLAILRVTDPAWTATAAPLSLADRATRQSPVRIVQFDETEGVHVGSGQIVQISVRELQDSPHNSLGFTVLTEQNVNGCGAVALADGRLVGLIAEYDRSSRTGEVVPYPVLRHFIRDVRTPPYKGFASAGFVWGPLCDPVKRKFLGLPPGDNGVFVLSCIPRSGADVCLRPGDVVMKWDGHAIDQLGFYHDPEFGRLAFPFLIKGRREPGEELPVELIRGGTNLTVRVTLARANDLDAFIPENVTGERAEYLMDGGFLIRELTGHYLRAHGADWTRNVDSRLAHLYLTRRHAPERPNDRVVILASVIPDAINIGYQHLRNQVLTRVNDEPVRNLRDVFRIVDRDGGLRRVRLMSVDVDIVIDPNQRAAANARLMRRYRIPAARYHPPQTLP